MSILSAFNNQLINLSNNLMEMYPDDPDISFSNGAIQALKKTNPRKLHELFKEHILKYEPQILSEDNDFFLNYDFVENNKIINSDIEERIEELGKELIRVSNALGKD